MDKLQELGVAMIVRNAGATVERAIRSVLSVAQQIVVVDTGSQDKTASICSRLGCEIYFKKWTDDFSEARNHALNFMRTDWILSLDADEELDVDSFLKNKFFLNNENAGGIKVKIVNLLEQDKPDYQTVHTYSRLFRNNQEIRFEGRIHEQISDSIISTGLEIIDSDIIIRHYGYIQTGQEKIDRNRELLEKELQSKPEDVWYNYHLAETEFAAGDKDKAKALFESIVNSTELSLEQRENVFIKLAQIALNKDDFDGLDKWLNFKSENVNNEGFRKFILATALMLLKRFSEAKVLLESPEVGQSGLVDTKSLQKAHEVINIVLKPGK